MNLSERIEESKPYITGFVLGIIAAPIVAFSAGWITTTSARDEAVENARVETLVSFCSENAVRLAATQSLDLTTIKGYGNRAMRGDLVKATLADIKVPEALATRVASACDRSLT
ncbi:hypothetical protein ACUN0C_10525 [Faunimonas sp. B44]|uniref:hypothetical protein n=1 Tax=Faunimonas sp. B44 TaxID=3461493 RepID=UPI004044B09F